MKVVKFFFGEPHNWKVIEFPLHSVDFGCMIINVQNIYGKNLLRLGKYVFARVIYAARNEIHQTNLR